MIILKQLTLSYRHDGQFIMNQIEGFVNDAGQLMEAILKNNVNGEEAEVTATTNHPDSSYGQAVWADGKGTAYCQAGMEAPFYTAIKK